jgi:hypothetical protein
MVAVKPFAEGQDYRIESCQSFVQKAKAIEHKEIIEKIMRILVGLPPE